jgi:hypothetical protein
MHKLVCDNNNLTLLPEKLPESLELLNCAKNRLTRLPDVLPESIQIINCCSNHLSHFPDTLPARLSEIFHTDNYLLPDRESNESIREYIARVNAIAETQSKERITQRCAVFFEELAQKVWHPSRVEKLMLAGIDMEEM